VPGPDFEKQFGRGEDFTEFEEEKDEIIIDPNLDFVRKRQGLGGAVPMEKQLGRPIEIDLDEDEEFVMANPAAAIPNDPAKPKVIGLTFDKQGTRFKYEPEAADRPENEEVIIPVDVKPLDREKVLFKMERQQERFPAERRKENLDLDDIANGDGEFRGTDLADVAKAFKATKPHEAVPNFDHYQSLAKFRVDLPKDPYGDGNAEAAKEEELA